MDTFNEAARRQRAAMLLVKEAAVEFDAAARLRGQAPAVDAITAMQEQLAGGLSARTRDRSEEIAHARVERRLALQAVAPMVNVNSRT